jgi:ABC-type Fe3+/spermidine/putrescine transport system ATPase subunit
LLTVHNLTKQYPSQPTPAVQGVSFGLAEAEIFTIVGESGAGKTTLMRLMAGLEEPDAGEVRYKGRPLPGPSQRLVPGHREIALAHQHQGLSPTMNIFDNLTLALLHLPKKVQEARVDQLLEMCGLHEVRRKFPRELSGGEQQRVGLARALAQQARVLLLDEPFSNLNMGLRHQLRRDLAGIVEQSQATLVLVTHDPADALAISHRIGVLRAGRLQQVGPPQELYFRPGSDYVAQLFGEVNLLSISELNQISPVPADVPTHLRACVRPEQVLPCPAGEAQFWGMVVGATFQGSHYLAEVAVGELRLLVALPGAHPPAGELPLRLALGAVHWLEPGA